MMQAHHGQELQIRLGPNPTALAELFRIIAAQGVDVLAYNSFSDWEGPAVLLLARNSLRARHAILEAGYDCTTQDVIVVEQAYGFEALAWVAQRLCADGVHVLYSYASSTPQGECYAVFNTNHNQFALEALQEKGFARVA